MHKKSQNNQNDFTLRRLNEKVFVPSISCNTFLYINQGIFRTMRIGFDAKWFFTGPVSTRVILHNLLPILIEKFPEHEWVIFLDRKDQGKQLRFNQNNTRIIYVPVTTNMLANLFVLPAYGRKLKLDVVLTQTFPAPGNTFRSVSMVHDVLFEQHPEFFTWKEKVYFYPLRWFTRKANKVIVTSSSVAEDLVQFKYVRSPDEIHIVPLAVGKQYKPLRAHDPARVEFVKQKYMLPLSFILFVGRLNARKNIEALLKALPLLDDKEIKLVIVGEEDWKRPAIREILRDPSISERVQMTGAINEEDLVVLYSLATVFCYPSFAEGFGLPPLEAMASAVPVVVSDTTSLPEVCGDAALYADPRVPSSIAEKINDVVRDPKLAQELIKKGIERSAKFTWESTAIGIMETIKTVVKK